MSLQDKKQRMESPEGKSLMSEQKEYFEQEAGKVPEKREGSRFDKIVSEELKQEIEMMEQDDKTKAEAKNKAEKIRVLGEKEKIEHLLEIARDKGVIFAIQVARKMNEPYILDILHDTLGKEGFFKDFAK